MAGFIGFMIWITGGAVSWYLYYKRRCGVTPSRDEPGLISAAIPSMIWPLMWFSEDLRDPAPCQHPAHILLREAATPPSSAGGALAPSPVSQGGPSVVIESNVRDNDPIAEVIAKNNPPVAIENNADVTQPAEHGQDQGSTDVDGYDEGDRVRLAKPFWGKPEPDDGSVLLRDWSGPERGDPPTYVAGSKGTIIYPDDSTDEQIRDIKEFADYLVGMDDGRMIYAGGLLPGIKGADLERISGRPERPLAPLRRRAACCDPGRRTARDRPGSGLRVLGVDLKLTCEVLA